MEISEQYCSEYKTMCRICMSTTDEIGYYDIFDDQSLTNVNISDEIFFVTNLEVRKSFYEIQIIIKKILFSNF